MDTCSITANVLAFWFLMNLCIADKLSPGQKPPPGATNSGGVVLAAPLAGNGAADVGKRTDVGRSGGSPPKLNIPAPPAVPQEDGVIREETEELKEVDGQLVRVVKGNFGYDSPEGLPVAVKYVADENGNRASFTIGKPGSGSGSGGAGRGNKPGGNGSKSASGSTKSDGGGGGGGGGAGAGGGGGGGKGGGKGSGSGPGGASTYLPPTMKKEDRSYLPPS